MRGVVGSTGGARVPKALPKAWGQAGVQDLENVDFSDMMRHMLQNVACEVQRRPVFRH